MREPKTPRRLPRPRLPATVFAWDGERFEGLIVEHGMTDQEIADWVGVSPKTVFNWRKNVTEPSGSRSRLIETLFEIERGSLYVEKPRDPSSSTALRSAETEKPKT